MNKLKITKIDKELYNFKGFDHIGCHKSGCDDACCIHGADFDKESYDLVFKYKDLIEKETGIKVKDCFTGEWYDDPEFLGGNATESKVLSSGFCAFHTPNGEGCILYKLVNEKGLPRRLIPTICRLYPLTWGNQELFIAEDLYSKCNCTHKNCSSKNILETQKEEVEDIFDIELDQ